MAGEHRVLVAEGVTRSCPARGHFGDHHCLLGWSLCIQGLPLLAKGVVAGSGSWPPRAALARAVPAWVWLGWERQEEQSYE